MNYMGHDVNYWLELKMRADENKLDSNLLEEVIKLKGKVAFYESRIKQMTEIMES